MRDQITNLKKGRGGASIYDPSMIDDVNEMS